jgi:hypothetical protein
MMTNHRLSIWELDTAVGGMKDNPYEDKANQRNAAQHGAGGTFGGSIGGILIGPIGSPDPTRSDQIGGHPVTGKDV